MPTKSYRLLSVSLVLLLAGCGTNVKKLLDEDGRLSWQADPIVTAAEELDHDLVEPFIEAEIAKIKACDALYTAAEESFDDDEWSYAQKLWLDLTMIIARVFPVESVERCVRAHALYGQELVALREHLEMKGVNFRSND